MTDAPKFQAQPHCLLALSKSSLNLFPLLPDGDKSYLKRLLRKEQEAREKMLISP